MEKIKLFRCTCVDEAQDKEHGTGLRAHERIVRSQSMRETLCAGISGDPRVGAIVRVDGKEFQREDVLWVCSGCGIERGAQRLPMSRHGRG